VSDKTYEFYSGHIGEEFGRNESGRSLTLALSSRSSERPLTYLTPGTTFIGIITIAIILRYGHGAEPFAWALPFLLQPFSAVFYPVDVLPRAMQAVAWWLPSTYVFEGMRAVIRSGIVPWRDLGWAVGLNLVYLGGAIWLLTYTFGLARDRGLLGKWGMQ
jgi:ABC-type multidrug transport system permease subunit